MALWDKYKVKQPLSPKQPGNAEGLLAWTQRELYPLLRELTGVLNWAVDWLGKVGVDSTDVPAPLESKVVAGQNITITKLGDEGDRTLRFSAAGGSPGVPSDPGYEPPPPYVPPDPVVEGSYLYTAYIEDPLYRGAARCLLPHGEGTAFIGIWTQTSGVSTWTWSYAGRLYGADASGAGSIELQDGDIVYSWDDVPYGDDAVHFGPYEVVDCGYHLVQAPGAPEGVMMGVSSKPVIRRITTANTPSGLCHGMVMYVEEEGAYFTIDTSDPIVVDTTYLSVSKSDTYTPAYDKELLTGAQLVSEHASGATKQSSATAVGGAGKCYFDTVFETLAGTPMAETIPAGAWRFWMKDAWALSIGDGDITVGFDVHRVYGGLTELVLDAESTPLSTYPTNYDFQGLLASDYTSISPTDTIRILPWARNTGTGTTSVAFTYNDIGRYTKVQTTLSMPSGAGAVGREHWPIGTATETAGVVNEVPMPYEQVRLTPTTRYINGICKTGFSDGGLLILIITNASPGSPVELRHNWLGGSGDNWPLGLPPLAGQANGTKISLKAPSEVAFRLDEVNHSWCLRWINAYSVVGA